MTLFQFLAKENVIAFVTYLSLAVTVYFSVRVRHKKIRYTCLNRKGSSEYVIVFWNACSQPIFRQDLYYFYALVNTCCTDKQTYPVETDIPLEIRFGEDTIDCFKGQKFNRHTKRMNMSFDFLPTKQGYIIYIDNIQDKKYLPAKVKICGRLRGEKEESVEKSKIDLSSNLLMIIQTFISTFSLFSSVLSLLSIINANIYISASFTYFSITITLFLAFLIGRYFYYYFMPGSLRKRVKEYMRQSFTEVEI